jgi:hypothetical protein
VDFDLIEPTGMHRPVAQYSLWYCETPARSPEYERLFPPLLRVHHGEVAPADAHVALRYRGG